MSEQNLKRIAAEEMAIRARESQSTVRELFEHEYHITFRTSGHISGERIEHSVDVTPELIQLAETILDNWQKR